MELQHMRVFMRKYVYQDFVEEIVFIVLGQVGDDHFALIAIGIQLARAGIAAGEVASVRTLRIVHQRDDQARVAIDAGRLGRPQALLHRVQHVGFNAPRQRLRPPLRVGDAFLHPNDDAVGLRAQLHLHIDFVVAFAKTQLERFALADCLSRRILGRGISALPGRHARHHVDIVQRRHFCFGQGFQRGKLDVLRQQRQLRQ